MHKLHLLLYNLHVSCVYQGQELKRQAPARMRFRQRRREVQVREGVRIWDELVAPCLVWLAAT